MKSKINIVANTSFMLMKFFLFLLVLSLSFFTTMYSKGVLMADPLKTPISVCGSAAQKLPVDTSTIFKYLGVIWLILAVSLIPFHFVIYNADGTINETNSKTLQTCYFLVYNLPIYVFILALLFLFVNHLSHVFQDNNYCNPDRFVNPVAESNKFWPSDSMA
jgi:hypothetical protein